MRTLHAGGIAAAIIGLTALVSAPSMADSTRHDSNTLHKMGNAIQYPVRKAGENLSIDVHRGQGHESIATERPQHVRAVVMPQGKKIALGHINPDPNGPTHPGAVYAHRHRIYTGRWNHNGHWYHHRRMSHGAWIYF